MDNSKKLLNVISMLERIVSNLAQTEVSRPEKKRSVGLVVREERGRGSEDKKDASSERRLTINSTRANLRSMFRRMSL